MTAFKCRQIIPVYDSKSHKAGARALSYREEETPSFSSPATKHTGVTARMLVIQRYLKVAQGLFLFKRIKKL